MALINRAKATTATTGTGAVTLGSGVAPFQSWSAAGAVAGLMYSYLIEQGSAWEIGRGVYDGTTLSRPGPSLDPYFQSSTGSLLSLTAGAIVSCSEMARDFQPWDFQPPLTSSFPTAQGQGSITFTDDPDVGLMISAPRNGSVGGDDGHTVRVRPIPNNALDWTVTAQINGANPTDAYGGGGLTPAYYGLVLTNAAGNKCIDWGFDLRGTAYFGYFNLPYSWGGTENATLWRGVPNWFRLQHVAASNIINYQVSPDGKNWGTLVSAADTAWFGALPDNVGLGVRMNTTPVASYNIDMTVPYMAYTGGGF